MANELSSAMGEAAELVEQEIDHLLPMSDLTEAKLFEAMRYACLGGGKRLRPLSGADQRRRCSASPGSAPYGWRPPWSSSTAYSLVHDDLPAMDNSDLRRGRPTVHRQFDHATAILAGDALLTLAFEVLADPATHEDPKVRCALVASLAKAAGMHGMVGGQMLDLIAEHEQFDMGSTTRLQRLKTGEMIAFSCCAGAILGKASQPQMQALHNYAHDLGLAFQIADDLLDIDGDPAITGKPAAGCRRGQGDFRVHPGRRTARANRRACLPVRPPVISKYSTDGRIC